MNRDIPSEATNYLSRLNEDSDTKQGISERQRVIDEYRAMMDDGREMIPLDSDPHQSDPVIIQHIMQMIDTDIFWYGETFRQVITELRKKALNETTMYTGEKLDENEHFE